MSITDRPMFRDFGVNPAQVAGGIYNIQNLGGTPPPVTPVAAQPIQVDKFTLKDLVSEARVALNNPGADPAQVAALTKQLDDQGIPAQALIAKVAAQPLVTGKTAVETFDEPEVDPSDLEFSDEEPVEVPDFVANELASAGEEATAKTVNAGEVPVKAAENAVTKGRAALAAFGDAEEDFEAQITAVTTGSDLEGATSKNYNKLAKEYLGLDSSEKDIPEWAAPVFLFGLNLMKAPVSTATRDTGLGGFLADVGKAGEVGVASFAKERARKRKEKIAVGQVALDLKKSDDATRIAAATAKVKRSQWLNTFLLSRKTEERLDKTAKAAARDRAADFVATQNERVTNRFTKGADVERTGAWITEFDNILNKASPELLKNIYNSPSQLNLIGAFAAKRAGLQPDFETKTLEFGSGKKLEYSVKGLQAYARKNNIDPAKVLTAVTNDPNNSKYAGIAVAVNLGKDQVQIENRPSEGGAVVTPVYIDKRAMIEEQTAAREENRSVDQSKFEKLGTPYLNAKPDFEKVVLGNVGGVEKYAYVNRAKLTEINLARKKKGKSPIDLMGALQTPDLAPGVVSKQYSNTSGALDNVSVVTISTGPYTKQQFFFNKNTLDAKREEIAKELNIPEDQVASLIASGTSIPWEVLQKTGVFMPVGKEQRTSKPVTRTMLGKDGTFTVMTGEPNQLAGMDSAAEQAKLKTRVVDTTIANRAANLITGVIEEAAVTDDDGLVTSKWSTVLGKAVALKNLFPGRTGNSFSKLKNFDLHSDSTKEDRARTIGMLDTWSSKFDDTAKGITANEADRQKLKSLFTDLAFSMASAREGGKLTDNDVRWAFETLGFNSDDYLQNPSKVLAGLRTAIETVNVGTEMRLMEIHVDAADIRKNNLDPTKKKRYILEEVLAAKWAGVQPRDDGREFYTGPKGNVIYRYDRRPPSRLEAVRNSVKSSGQSTGQPPASAPSSVQFGGETIPLTGTLNAAQIGLIKRLENAKLPRSIEGVKTLLKGNISPTVIKEFEELNRKGFFNQNPGAER